MPLRTKTDFVSKETTLNKIIGYQNANPLKTWNAKVVCLRVGGIDGNREVGFLYSRNHDHVLQALWDRCGDHENFFWEPGMKYPEPT